MSSKKLEIGLFMKMPRTEILSPGAEMIHSEILACARAWAWAKKLGYHPKQWAELALQDLIEKEGLKGITVRL